MLLPGTIINNRYELLEGIYRGGMGEVWVVKDKVLGRKVALKTVNTKYLEQNPKAISILFDEANTGAKLIGHPNVVTVLDFGEYTFNSTSTHFLAMEYVEGMTVGKWINDIKPKLDPLTYYNISLLIAWEICKAISFAHRKGILHRDIKPLNVFLSDYGVTKVGDFGLARFVDAVTRTHTVWKAMSPAYAAPEQWKGEKHTENTDIYQLGCTLYHIFTGSLPFDLSGLPVLMNAHLNEKPEPPHIISDLIPENLSNKILGTLEKKPKNRTDLWQINDAIADEIQIKYILEIDVHEESEPIQKIVSEITEFGLESLKKGSFEFTFPDFSEVLSESIQVILAGVTNFKVRRVDTLEKKAAS